MNIAVQASLFVDDDEVEAIKATPIDPEPCESEDEPWDEAEAIMDLCDAIEAIVDPWPAGRSKGRIAKILKQYLDELGDDFPNPSTEESHR